jgi:predicted lactoylglutathione lyase
LPGGKIKTDREPLRGLHISEPRFDPVKSLILNSAFGKTLFKFNNVFTNNNAATLQSEGQVCVAVTQDRFFFTVSIHKEEIKAQRTVHNLKTC